MANMFKPANKSTAAKIISGPCWAITSVCYASLSKISHKIDSKVDDGFPASNLH
jgi:hypothetical protein